MMTLLPDCPKCGEPDLYRMKTEHLWLRCAECGWSSYIVLRRVGETEAELVDRTVRDGMAVERRKE